VPRPSDVLSADLDEVTGRPDASPPGDATSNAPELGDIIGRLPYRLQLAGGWIDQPFMSARNPEPPGSMVVVSLQPSVRFMDRSGMASGTRASAFALWGDQLPSSREPMALVRELYAAENAGQVEPSGSQDMIGVIFPGVSRLDYDASVDGGWFPSHIESTCDPGVAKWLERRLHLLPVSPRPLGYGPLEVKRLDADWVRRLGESGKDCYNAIVGQNLAALGASLNECSACWDALLPHTLAHPTINLDLKALLAWYQDRYEGAMYSGCGGGYLIVASAEDVPGSFRVSVRTE
jgi:hypothetical protein